MATSTEARQAIFDNVAKNAPGANSTVLLKLAEAFAWAERTDQAHGGTVSVSS